MKLILILSMLFLVACASKPGAIGVAYNQDGIVRYVFSGWPAETAGIKVGDKILNRKELRGEIGTKCLVKVQRESSYFEILVERADVEKLNNENHSW